MQTCEKSDALTTRLPVLVAKLKAKNAHTSMTVISRRNPTAPSRRASWILLPRTPMHSPPRVPRSARPACELGTVYSWDLICLPDCSEPTSPSGEHCYSEYSELRECHSTPHAGCGGNSGPLVEATSDGRDRSSPQVLQRLHRAIPVLCIAIIPWPAAGGEHHSAVHPSDTIDSAARSLGLGQLLVSRETVDESGSR